jgi:hypothetical protein
MGAVKEERKLMKSQSFARALGPTMVCVYALLVLKTAQQSFVDSLPLITVRGASRQPGKAVGRSAGVCFSVCVWPK